MKGWIGVDLDGTLAMYEGWKGPEHVGEPVPAMVERVKAWLAAGQEVRIFTARVYWDHGEPVPNKRWAEASKSREAIGYWCRRYLGVELEVTCTKDFGMVELWDDRAVQVVPNTGARADGKEG